MTTAALERSEVRFGTKTVEYVIRRSARRATVSIAVDPAVGVVVTAPQPTSIRRLDDIVHTKASWIFQRLRRQSDLPRSLAKREFVSGETFRYLGRQYRLRVLSGAPRPLSLHAGWLEVTVPSGLATVHKPEYVRAALLDWYRRRAEDRLRPLAASWAKRVGVRLAAVMVRDQSKRWGSCDRHRTVRLNWRIIQAPMRLVEYVVAHEVVHVLHRDHGREFWRSLGRAMPDYEARRDALKRLGPELEW